MKINKIFTAIAITALLVGCSAEDELASSWRSDADAVKISLSVAGHQTGSRSNPVADIDKEGDVTQFNEGDQIGVTNAGKTVAYTLTNGEWVPETGKYLKWGWDNNFDVVYPYNHSEHSVFNQNTKERIAQADYMKRTSVVSEIPLDRTLRSELKRQTARIIVCIKELKTQFDEGEFVESLYTNYEYENDEGHSYLSGSPYVIGNGGVGTQYVFLMSSDDTFKGITLYTSSNKSLYCNFSPTLEAGKSYTYNLSVGKDKVDVESITVEDWTDGTLPDGQGGEVTIAPYVTFTADAAQKFMMTATAKYIISELQYSVGGNDWTDVEANKEVEFGGDKGSLFLRGKKKYGTSLNDNYSTITFTYSAVKVACTGDIRTLLDWENYQTVNTEKARFSKLFYNCTALTSAPELPATTLADNCYSNMFYGCSSLETAPELPATTLAKYCYYFMFSGCSSLKTAPEFTATTLADFCYYGMFSGCSSLETAPELPATAKPYCYFKMFENCSKISSITMLAPSSVIAWAQSCVKYCLKSTGTDASVTSRTLKVKDKAAYNALVTEGLDDNWKIDKCTVLDENGNVITEDSNN